MKYHPKLPILMPDQVIEDLEGIKEILKQSLKMKEMDKTPLLENLINTNGKLVRPILHIMFARLFGYNDTKHLNCAAAVELIHNASLLHDDVLDHAELRRGKPSYNSMFGNHPAVLGGDYLFITSFNMLKEPVYKDILSRLIHYVHLMVKGELLELHYKNNFDITFDQYFDVVFCKTSSLMQASIVSGGQIAGVPSDYLELLDKIGEIAGIIFQVVDDAMDYGLLKAVTGKGKFNDIVEGNMTLPLLYLNSNCNMDESSQIKNMVGKEINEEQKNLLIELFLKYNIYEKIVTYLTEQHNILTKTMDKFPKNEYSESLLNLFQLFITRTL